MPSLRDLAVIQVSWFEVEAKVKRGNEVMVDGVVRLDREAD